MDSKIIGDVNNYVNDFFFFASVVSNSLRHLRASIVLKNSFPNKMT